MSLIDELEKEKQAHCCKTAEFLDTLSDDERATFTQWLEDEKPMVALYRACVRLGLSAGLTAFKEHVQGQHVPK